MEHLYEMLELVTGQLSRFATSEVVVGEPIELNDITVVPLSRVSVGFGGGGGEGEGELIGHKGKGKGQKGSICNGAHLGKGTGGGAGAGGKVRPVGVIIFDEAGVRVQAIPTRKGALDKMFDKLPDVLSLIRQAKGEAGQKD